MKTKTQELFELTAPYNNPYQGNDPRVLFVCSAGLLRSPTCAKVAAEQGFNTRSCGSHSYALIPISANLVAWADHIVFVNEENVGEAIYTFEDYPHILNSLEKKSVIWDLPDVYEYNDPKLVSLIKDWLANTFKKE